MVLPAIEAAARLAVAALSVLVFFVALVAYRRRPTGRMLVVLALFFVFLVQGLVLMYEVFVTDSTFAESAYYGFQLVEIALVATILLKA